MCSSGRFNWRRRNSSCWKWLLPALHNTSYFWPVYVEAFGSTPDIRHMQFKSSKFKADNFNDSSSVPCLWYCSIRSCVCVWGGGRRACKWSYTRGNVSNIFGKISAVTTVLSYRDGPQEKSCGVWRGRKVTIHGTDRYRNILLYCYTQNTITAKIRTLVNAHTAEQSKQCNNNSNNNNNAGRSETDGLQRAKRKRSSGCPFVFIFYPAPVRCGHIRRMWGGHSLSKACGMGRSCPLCLSNYTPAIPQMAGWPCCVTWIACQHAAQLDIDYSFLKSLLDTGAALMAKAYSTPTCKVSQYVNCSV